MLDIALIREKTDWVKEQIRKLNDQDALTRIDIIVNLDARRRQLLTEVEQLQGARNRLNKGMGRLRGNKNLDDSVKAAIAQQVASAIRDGNLEKAETLLSTEPAEIPESHSKAAFDALIAALKELGERVDGLWAEVKQVEAELEENMLWIPNLPHASVPVAENEEGNIPWEPEGEIREFDFEPRPHWELGPELDIIDFDRGVKLAGSRAYILLGWGAKLQRALSNWFLDMAAQKGYREVYVPFIVNEAMMYGSAQFPKFRDVVYYDPEAEKYFLPTAEVAITNMFREEILEEAQLPLYVVGHTPCFRREKMSAGKDVRGIKRVHQFQKVEMYKFTTPETSYEELERMTEDAADLCRALKIPFRRLEIATGDLGFSASKKYDIEMWSPGIQEWLEVSSCSNTEDFQARRAMIRYRREGEKKTQFVHTLNGSGLALPRVIIAIIENYQQADGSVVVPEVLRPYLGGVEVIRKEN